jgi:hypothetical protein
MKKGTSMISIVKGKTEISHNLQTAIMPLLPQPRRERKNEATPRMGSPIKLVGGVASFWSGFEARCDSW